MKQKKQDIAKRLKPYRKQIDELDIELLKLLGKRFGIIRKVAALKKKEGIPSFIHGRVEEVRNNAVRIGKKYGIDSAFVFSLWSAIIYHSCATEDQIKSKK